MFNLVITAYHPGRKTQMKTSEFINGNWEKYKTATAGNVLNYTDSNFGSNFLLAK